MFIIWNILAIVIIHNILIVQQLSVQLVLLVIVIAVWNEYTVNYWCW